MLQRCEVMLRICAGFMWCLLTGFNILLPRKRTSTVTNKKQTRTQNSGERNLGNVHCFRGSWLLLLFALGDLVYTYWYSLINLSLCKSLPHWQCWTGLPSKCTSWSCVMRNAYWHAFCLSLRCFNFYAELKSAISGEKKEIGFDRCCSLNVPRNIRKGEVGLPVKGRRLVSYVRVKHCLHFSSCVTLL